jgi:HEAT repeat protein
MGRLGLAAAALVAWLGPRAFADVKKGSPPALAAKKPASRVNIAALTEKLKSSDPADLEAALAEAKSAGKAARAVAPVIEELLARGVSREVTLLALDALGEVGAESSSPALVLYCRHRDPDVRKRGLAALSRIGGTVATATVRAALSDPDAGVRGAAASGLGALKSRDAVQDLFLALDHEVLEAASSIGQVCSPDECEKLASKVSTLGLDVMTGAFDAILFRPTSEIPDDEKLRVVERVKSLHTEEANKYLRDVASRLSAGSSPRVRQAIDQAVLATAGAKS